MTNGHPDGIHRNTLAGFDGVYRTSEFLGNKVFVGAWTAFASGDVGTGDRTGYGFKVDYPNDRWDCFVSFNKYGDSLDPALGFLPRPGIRRYQGACEFRPRPRLEGRYGGSASTSSTNVTCASSINAGRWRRSPSSGRLSTCSWNPAT